MLPVSGAGAAEVGECSQALGGCACCCNDKIVQRGYQHVDLSKSVIIVGPKLRLTSFCGCHPSKVGAEATADRASVTSHADKGGIGGTGARPAMNADNTKGNKRVF